MVSLRRMAKRARLAAAARRARLAASRPVAVENDQMGAFQVLPMELILSVLTALAASADKPADLLNAMLVCKGFLNLVINPQVLRAASAACVSVLPPRWCAAADRFLRYCGDHGNADANYFLGMIQFYCLGLHNQGWTRLMLAVMGNHAHAAFAAAVINYNGSFRDCNHMHAISAAHQFALAADYGHEGALRDLALCVTDGFGGVPPNPAAGERITLACNLRELRATYPTSADWELGYAHLAGSPGCLTSELGCFTTVPASLNGFAHPANRFLCDWFAAPPRHLVPFTPMLCSFPTCGRPETRGLEYRRCPVCGIARYCSRTCQSLHWRTGHSGSGECVPVHQWLMEAIANYNLQAAFNFNFDANAALPAVNNNNNLGGGAGGAAGAGAGAAPM